MKKKLLLTPLMLLCVSGLAACGGEKDPTPPGPSGIELIDSREDAFTAVSGEMDSGEFFEDGITEDFPSLYEAANWVYYNCENGSYVMRKGDANKEILWQKRANVEEIGGTGNEDQWHYYKNGSELDGYAYYLTGYTELYRDDSVSAIMTGSASLKPTYQPYTLLRPQGAQTASWNLLMLQDASVRYNPLAFTGMRTETFTFALTEAKIRPSYNEAQKAVPFITLSSTDSYNWSNQGIYMDTDTGNWYYLYGETQSESKSLEYGEEVILTSTWDEEKQEFTPDSDVTMTLEYVYHEDEEIWTNTLKIVTNENTFDFEYEYSQMNGRGTPRANVSLDLVPADDSYDEIDMAPDFMCGAYFKNITVTSAKGSVPEGLTDDEYSGDWEMCGVPGETYDLTLFTPANAAGTEVIIDNNGCVTYHDEITTKDVFDISFEQRVSSKARSAQIEEVETLIRSISETDTKESANVIAASEKFDLLNGPQAILVEGFDGLTQLAAALKR